MYTSANSLALSPFRPSDVPRRPKSLVDLAQTAQDALKIAPRRPDTVPRRPKKAQDGPTRNARGNAD
eukprot:2718424-Pyramimonas_sp.AAC.1